MYGSREPSLATSPTLTPTKGCVSRCGIRIRGSSSVIWLSKRWRSSFSVLRETPNFCGASCDARAVRNERLCRENVVAPLPVGCCPLLLEGHRSKSETRHSKTSILRTIVVCFVVQTQRLPNLSLTSVPQGRYSTCERSKKIATYRTDFWYYISTFLRCCLGFGKLRPTSLRCWLAPRDPDQS